MNDYVFAAVLFLARRDKVQRNAAQFRDLLLPTRAPPGRARAS